MNLKKILVEQLSPESDFGKILAIKKGTVDKTDIEFSPEYVYDFDDKYMYFDFDGAENYLRYFLDPDYAEDGYGVEDVDQWVYALNGGFLHDEYLDYSNVDDEWDGGYILSSLNQENQEKLDKIILLLKPDGQDLIKKVTYDNRQFYADTEEMSKFLEGVGSLKDPLSDVYHDAINESHSVDANREVQEDGQKMLAPLGFEPDGREFHFYKIPLANIALLYSRYSDNVNDDLTEVLRKAASKMVQFPPSDSTWEYLSEAGDPEVFNKIYQPRASKILDNVTEEILENSKNLEEYRKIYKYISGKYGFDKKNFLPNVSSDPNSKIRFTVQSVDPTTNMLNLYFEKDWKARRTQMTFSDFINLMNNARLFNFGDIFD
jgi:hypothetical protein